MVLLPARADSGVAGVWQSGQGTLAATRAIVSAGDSLARKAAEAARPKVAPDSLSRAATAADTAR
jgi:rod shape-determining protein MreC